MGVINSSSSIPDPRSVAKHGSIHLLDPVGAAINATSQAAQAKGILVAVTTYMEGVEVADVPETDMNAIRELLAYAIERSPKRGVVTIDVELCPQEVTLLVIDQGVLRVGRDPGNTQFTPLWSTDHGTAHGLRFHVPGSTTSHRS